MERVTLGKAFNFNEADGRKQYVTYFEVSLKPTARTFALAWFSQHFFWRAHGKLRCKLQEDLIRGDVEQVSRIDLDHHRLPLLVCRMVCSAPDRIMKCGQVVP